MKATNIKWDLSEVEESKREEILATLPTEIDIPNDITDLEDIEDYIIGVADGWTFEEYLPIM